MCQGFNHFLSSLRNFEFSKLATSVKLANSVSLSVNTGELRCDEPLYEGFIQMTDNMLGPSPMHIKYLSYVYDRFCI